MGMAMALPRRWLYALIPAVLLAAVATAVFPPAAGLFVLLPVGLVLYMVAIYRPGYPDAVFQPVIFCVPFEYDLGSGLRPIHFAGLLALFALAAYLAVNRRLPIRTTAVDVPAMLLVGWAWCGIFWTPDFVGGVQVAVRITFGLLLYFMPRVFLTDAAALRRCVLLHLASQLCQQKGFAQ